ncbi:MAG: hypothetical protein KC420_04170 [Myxococcales bacterium]|nr:hypothetical protein [Myxococcales bacterium]
MTKWKKEERRACKLLGADHVGGSGRPDCVGSDFIAEVKAYNGRRVDRGTLRRTRNKHWAAGEQLKFVSTSGYTDGAVEYAAVEGIDLFVSRGGELHPHAVAYDDEPMVEETSTAEDIVTGIAIFAGVVGAAALLTAGLNWLADNVQRPSR